MKEERRKKMDKEEDPRKILIDELNDRRKRVLCKTLKFVISLTEKDDDVLGSLRKLMEYCEQCPESSTRTQ